MPDLQAMVGELVARVCGLGPLQYDLDDATTEVSSGSTIPGRSAVQSRPPDQDVSCGLHVGFGGDPKRPGLVAIGPSAGSAAADLGTSPELASGSSGLTVGYFRAWCDGRADPLASPQPVVPA